MIQLLLWPLTLLSGLQAVALGAAVQAGILEGQVSDVMVLDVWQATLMRAFAKQRLRQDRQLAAQAGLDPDQLEDSSDDEVSKHDQHCCCGKTDDALVVVHRLQSRCDTGRVCGVQVLD